MDKRGHLVDRSLPVLALLFHLVAPGYGIFRDELYYVACGRHLDWGYVDHPPMIGVIARLVEITLGTSVPALRFLPAVAAAATVWIAMRMSRDMGGGRTAATLAAVMTFLCPLFMSLFSILSMNCFDVLFWALLWWMLVRILNGGDRRLWIVFGLVAGVTLLNKISILYLGAGLAAGVVLSRRWDLVRERRLWIAILLAAVVFLPHLLWQARQGWPTLEFMENARRYKMAALSPLEFLSQTGLCMGPFALPVILAGAGWLLLGKDARNLRLLGWAFPVILLVMITTHAKDYYLGPAYTLLFSAGGVAVERLTARPGLRAARVVALLLIFVNISLIPIAKPVLPVETYIRYASRIGYTPSAGENHEMGRLPQFFADMHGWRELAETVAGVYHALPAEEQAKACIFGQNYGEAGAIDYFGKDLGLPGAISGHNSYHLWGSRGCTAEVLIVMGDDRETLEGLFEEVELGATFRSEYVMPYENNLPVWVVRRPKVLLEKLWPEVKKFI